ncbi:LysR family transcriptional regulator [Parashewanella spongiae]|uniref:LysR family transcriptional regulator n=1 Tax=Parashewanella spongiae TaxID=342950 RepID=A0A3A6UC78_9GAMM|nr:DNA-binding transcriptional activator PunR [Parashewanella spongiae]MCL1076862.1 LysR family transcriptional regulator [Parashewanella spongiae]RJY19229.1 LysR family transcriptional regulator [Parashewanella spongiae]
MLSESLLNIIDTVSRLGSFTAAANYLNKVPSAISYSIKQVEDELGTPLFVRHHRSVTLTPAGEHFLKVSRDLLKQLQDVKHSTQRVANNWQPTICITFDSLVRADKISALIAHFYKKFDDVELIVRLGVFNGVLESLVTGQSDLAIGATAAIPNGGYFKYINMGKVDWIFCVNSKHPLSTSDIPLTDESLRQYPVVCIEDTAKETPKRELWRLANQRRIVVPDWIRAINCVSSGLGVGFFPRHLVDIFISSGRLVEMKLESPILSEPCCIAWNDNKRSTELEWLLDYVGSTENMHKEWLS